MTGLYPRVYDSDDDPFSISWLGESLNNNPMCSHCRCVRLIKESKRNFKCPECGLIFPISQEQESIKQDFNVCKLGLKDAFKYVSNEDLISRIKKENHNAIKRKFGVKTIEEEDHGLGSGVTIIREWEL